MQKSNNPIQMAMQTIHDMLPDDKLKDEFLKELFNFKAQLAKWFLEEEDMSEEEKGRFLSFMLGDFLCLDILEEGENQDYFRDKVARCFSVERKKKSKDKDFDLGFDIDNL